MSIVLNGQNVNIPEDVTTVQQLLAYYQLENRICVVERNRDIVMKEQYETTKLCSGDIIEIIHFVGGG